ncbi:MAG: diacylglycerol kinase [Planctomycetota bacterium]
MSALPKTAAAETSPVEEGPRLFAREADDIGSPAPDLVESAPSDAARVPRAMWRQRLVDAEGGVKQAVRDDSVFFVQMFAAATVGILGVALGLSAVEWALILAVGTCLTVAELVRQVVRVAAGLCEDRHGSEARRMLRLATAASSVAAVGGVLCTAMIFSARLWQLFATG